MQYTQVSKQRNEQTAQIINKELHWIISARSENLFEYIQRQGQNNVNVVLKYITNSQKNKIFNQQNLIFLARRDWDIVNTNYRQNLWQQIFSLTIKTYIFGLRVVQTAAGNQLMKQISHINFQNLIYLSLEENTINNIQEISHLNCPKVKILNFSSNFITNCKPLAKWVHSQVNQIKLFNNPLTDVNALTKFNFSKICQNRKMLHIYEYIPATIFEKSIMFKIQILVKFLQYLTVKDECLIQPKIIFMAKNKYPNLIQMERRWYPQKIYRRNR